MCTSIISNRKKTIVGWNLDLGCMDCRVREDVHGVYIEIDTPKDGCVNGEKTDKDYHSAIWIPVKKKA